MLVRIIFDRFYLFTSLSTPLPLFLSQSQVRETVGGRVCRACVAASGLQLLAVGLDGRSGFDHCIRARAAEVPPRPHLCRGLQRRYAELHLFTNISE